MAMLKSARHAIVDIGSNSIRLVVFSGSKRAPKVLYDDKVVAGLGRGVVARGRLDRRGVSLALSALKRFAALLRLVEPNSLQVVATAAVRDADNGAQFLEQVRALGLPARLLSGEDEARASAWGVVASHPGAHGLVADLGGGSLELARINADKVFECASFPFGIMPVEAIRAQGRGLLRAALKDSLAPLTWLEAVRGDQLLLVGGAWRALDKARVHLFGGGLGEAFPAGQARQIKTAMRELGARRLMAIPGVSSSRAAQLGHASALLSALVLETCPREVIVSNAGLREGLLFKGH